VRHNPSVAKNRLVETHRKTVLLFLPVIQQQQRCPNFRSVNDCIT